MGSIVGFLVFLLFLAALLRVDFYFYLFYLSVGVLAVGRLWAWRAARQVSYRRLYPERVFWGERPQVGLELHNRGHLPVLWLHAHDSLPIELRSPNFFEHVLSLKPRERVTLTYQLDCRRRGYWQLGPLALQSGDLLGATPVSLAYERPDTLIVYPKIVPLAALGLPSYTPFGTLRSKQRIFEDPTRVAGVRDYVPGDSQRHIAWKTSAVLGRLQVKRYQPAIALDVTIFVDLSRASYRQTRVWPATELAIVVAASLANSLAERRQAVGLGTNGRDPLADDAEQGAYPPTISPRKGRRALMRLLDLLARVETSEGPELATLLPRETSHLAWGSTVVVVTGRVTDELFEALAGLRKGGFSLVLISVDPGAGFQAVRKRASRIGVPTYEVWEEPDLERWGSSARRAV